MSAGTLYKNAYSKELEIVSLFAYIDIGSSGAPTLDTAKSKGIASITQNGTGDYTITLSDVYAAHLFTDLMYLESTSRDLTFQLLAVSASSKTIQFVVHAAASATNPTSGGVVLAHIKMKRSGV